MKLIKLVSNDPSFEEYAKVDEEDYEWLTKLRWSYNSGYAIHCIRADRRTVKIRMHRMILGVNDARAIVDHIDGDRLNNMKSNLRIVDFSLNRHNAITDINKVKLGVFRGVHYRSDRNKYEALFTTKGRKKLLGRFEDILDAAIAYDEAAIKTYGDNAITNFKIIEELYIKLKNKLTDMK